MTITLTSNFFSNGRPFQARTTLSSSEEAFIKKERGLSHPHSAKSPLLTRNLDHLRTAYPKDSLKSTPDEPVMDQSQLGLTNEGGQIDHLVALHEQVLFLSIKGLRLGSNTKQQPSPRELYCQLRLRLYGNGGQGQGPVYSKFQPAIIRMQQRSNASNFLAINTASFNIRASDLEKVSVPRPDVSGWKLQTPTISFLDVEISFDNDNDARSLLGGVFGLAEPAASITTKALPTGKSTLWKLPSPQCTITQHMTSLPVATKNEQSLNLNCRMEVELRIPTPTPTPPSQKLQGLLSKESALDDRIGTKITGSSLDKTIMLKYIYHRRIHGTHVPKTSPVIRTGASCLCCSSTYASLPELYRHILVVHRSIQIKRGSIEEDASGCIQHEIFFYQSEQDSPWEQHLDWAFYNPSRHLLPESKVVTNDSNHESTSSTSNLLVESLVEVESSKLNVVDVTNITPNDQSTIAALGDAAPALQSQRKSPSIASIPNQAIASKDFAENPPKSFGQSSAKEDLLQAPSYVLEDIPPYSDIEILSSSERSSTLQPFAAKPQSIDERGQPTPLNVRSLPRPARRKFTVPNIKEGRAYFRSVSKRKLCEGEEVSESDDDVSVDWIRRTPIIPAKGMKLSKDSKQVLLMNIWNDHMLTEQPKGKKQLAASICRFARDYRDEMSRLSLEHEFARRLDELLEDHLITKEVLEACKEYTKVDELGQCMDEVVNEASRKKRCLELDSNPPHPPPAKRARVQGKAAADGSVAALSTDERLAASRPASTCLCGEKIKRFFKITFCSNPVSSAMIL